MNNIDVLGLGEVVVDWVAELPHFPKPDEKIDALSENYFPGGVTANYLVSISRLGISCGFIGAVGDDSYGDFLISDFKQENIDTKLTFKIKNKRTPVNFIFITGGEKTIIQSPHMQITKLNLSQLDEFYIANSKHLHTTVIHPEIAKKVINIAKEHNITISIDLESQIAQRGWETLKDFLLACDVLIPNKEGAKSITNTKSPQEAAKTLIKKGIPIVIITLGNKGALITTRDFQKIVPTYEVKNIRDTTGAGDTFNGAFSVGYWIKGWNLEKSCRYANAAASLKIQELGARTGMPTENELLNFLKKNEDPFF
ncbi:MAG: carbohydrate kinase family protein [Promethearchaeota archaeon]|nr:MAG: carbohydrate kinase family protein [Candidatus Lokiarchaeota archaeon]